MAEEREILRYEMDASGALTEAAKLQEALRLLKEASTASGGNDVARGVTPVVADVAALTASASATDELIAKKRQLAMVVNMVGGGFGAEVAQLGGLVSLLMTATPVVGQVAIALASLGVGVKVFHDLRAAAERATKAQQELNAQLREMNGLQLQAEAGIAKGLEGFRARSPENIAASWKLMREVMTGFGKPQEVAAEAAQTAVGAGFGTPEDAAVLEQLKAAGVQIGTVADAQRVMGLARTNGDYERLLAEARPRAGDATAAANVAAGMILPVVPPARSATELAFDALKPQLPKEMSFDVFKKAFDDMNTLRADLAKTREEAAALTPKEGTRDLPGGGKSSRVTMLRLDAMELEISRLQERLAQGGIIEKWIGVMERVIDARQPVNQEGVSVEPGPTKSMAETYNITKNITNIATQHNTRDRRRGVRRRESSMTASSPMP